tara:strand:+ start:508 stop:1050 length:543 start_codon:yes stop_codon:yes gene_type:complete
MEIEMTGKINMNELMSELSTLVIKEQYIDSDLIEAWVTGWLNDNLQSHLVDSLNIENEIMEFMHNEDLSDYIDIQSHIDTCDIRYDIEDEILEQVNDHLDYDTIKYNIEDDITESVFSGFDITDHLDWVEIKEYCGMDDLERNTVDLEERIEALEASFDEVVENPPRKVGLIRRILGWLW